jgi:hypothetical protein
MPDVPMMPRSNGKDNFPARPSKPASDSRAERVEPGKDSFEVITSTQLAERWQVPERWIRDRTRSRTPKEDRIPCLRLGRYVRFEWGSPVLANWLPKKRH